MTGKKIQPGETIVGGKGYKIETEAEKKLELDKLLGPDDDVFGSPIKDWQMKKFKKPPKAKDVTPKETEAQLMKNDAIELGVDENNFEWLLENFMPTNQITNNPG